MLLLELSSIGLGLNRDVEKPQSRLFAAESAIDEQSMASAAGVGVSVAWNTLVGADVARRKRSKTGNIGHKPPNSAFLIGNFPT